MTPRETKLLPLEETRLAELIGVEETRKLLNTYGGEVMRIPDCRALKRLRRNCEILKLRGQGRGCAEIGKRFGLSERAVKGIVLRGQIFDVSDYEAFMPASFCELAQCIGLDAAERLCGALGNRELWFPELPANADD